MSGRATPLAQGSRLLTSQRNDRISASSSPFSCPQSQHSSLLQSSPSQFYQSLVSILQSDSQFTVCFLSLTTIAQECPYPKAAVSHSSLALRQKHFFLDCTCRIPAVFRLFFLQSSFAPCSALRATASPSAYSSNAPHCHHNNSSFILPWFAPGPDRFKIVKVVLIPIIGSSRCCTSGSQPL